MEAAGVEVRQPLGERSGGVGTLALQGPGERALVAAGQAVEPLGVLVEHRPVGPRLPLGPPARRRGQQPAEVAVPGPAPDQQGEPRQVDRICGDTTRNRRGDDRPSGCIVFCRLFACVSCPQRHLGADQRLDPRLAGRLVEAGGAVDAVAVDQGDRRQPQPRRPGDEVLGLRGAVEEREGRGQVELGVGRGGAPASSPPRTAVSGVVVEPPQLLLARPRAGPQPLQAVAEVARWGSRRPPVVLHPMRVGVNKA